MSGGNCPETPRQKMIGMMYLFYTALLALNVSGEVLNAFIAVNDGIIKTTANFSMKTGSLYAKIDGKVAEQPLKYGALGKQAHEIESLSNKFFNDIERLKLMCMQASDPEVKAVADGVKKMDDINAAPAIMTAEGGRKMADSLRLWMQNYRDIILGMDVFKNKETGAVDTSLSVYKGISNTLEIKDETSIEVEEKKTWEEGFCKGMPLIGTVALLSKLQSDVRNTEAEILEFMISELEGLDIRITALEGLVSTTKSFVVSGGEYSSSVFLGARDTTMRPTIYVTTARPFYDSTVVGGEVRYRLRDGVSYDTLTLDAAGKGQYSVSNAGVGDHSYGGLINYKSNRGDMWLPYESGFTVGQSGFTVSASKCNVFYRGLENPVEVSVSGYPKESVSVSISGGASIKPSKEGYVVTVPSSATAKEVQINVSVKTDAGSKSLGSKKFNVLNVPPPTIKVAGAYKDGADVPKVAISKNPYLSAALESDFFPFDGVKYSIAKYDFFYSVRGVTSKETINGSNFSQKVISEIQKMGAGSSVTFSNVFYNGPSGTRQTNGVTVRLK